MRVFVCHTYRRTNKQISACKYLRVLDVLEGASESRPRGLDDDDDEDDDNGAASIRRSTAVSETGTDE